MTNNNDAGVLQGIPYLQQGIMGVSDSRYSMQNKDEKAGYIEMILEFLETIDANQYFMAQWLYIADDTVILTTFLFNQYLQVKSILYFNSIGLILPFTSLVGH